jgi:hypothetical protein
MEPDMVGYAYNPSYLGGKGRSISSSKSAQAKVVARPCFKNSLKKN